MTNILIIFKNKYQTLCCLHLIVAYTNLVNTIHLLKHCKCVTESSLLELMMKYLSFKMLEEFTKLYSQLYLNIRSILKLH